MLDLVQLHCVLGDVLRKREVIETLRELKSGGQIRDFGASVFTAAAVKRYT